MAILSLGFLRKEPPSYVSKAVQGFTAPICPRISYSLRHLETRASNAESV